MGLKKSFYLKPLNKLSEIDILPLFHAKVYQASKFATQNTIFANEVFE